MRYFPRGTVYREGGPFVTAVYGPGDHFFGGTIYSVKCLDDVYGAPVTFYDNLEQRAPPTKLDEVGK